MEITNNKINIFVLGDLVLDHVVFVKTKKQHHQRVGKEDVFDVKTRDDNAGGAANSARILAALGRGRTYLWGVTGRSRFGDYPSVLEKSSTYDAAEEYIIFRGVHDETARMNTITRIVHVTDNGLHDHVARFDDVGHISITEPIMANAINNLVNAHKVSPLGAIILNDLDMGTLNSQIIKSIATFASDHHIPLFIDPKRDIKKYADIKATAIMPNLDEWIHIVEADKEQNWRGYLDNKDGLQQIACRSLSYLPYVKFHIIKCDQDGAVLICPNDGDKYTYDIYRVLPHTPNSGLFQNHQLGCGDILSAILALEYASSDSNTTAEKIMKAFIRANAVVASYREMPWQRMPRRSDIISLKSEPPKLEKKVSLPGGLCYIPRASAQQMDKLRTAVPTIVSVDENYRTELRNLITALDSSWDEESLRHSILTGKGGSGKSEVLKWLLSNQIEGLHVVDFSTSFTAESELSVVNAMNDEKDSFQSVDKRLLFIVDEFLKNGKQWINQRGAGVLLLEKAKENNIKFLLTDADLDISDNSQMSGSQFLSRCNIFTLPEIDRRLNDIPYIFISMLFGEAKKNNRNIGSITCQQTVLLTMINTFIKATMAEKSLRKLLEYSQAIFANASRQSQSVTSLYVGQSHLPANLPVDAVDEETVSFYR